MKSNIISLNIRPSQMLITASEGIVAKHCVRDPGAERGVDAGVKRGRDGICEKIDTQPACIRQ